MREESRLSLHCFESEQGDNVLEPAKPAIAQLKVPARRKMLWAGRIISAIPPLLLVFSGVMKILKPPSVVEGFAKYGYPETQVIGLGILEIACALVYLVPRTRVLGAILLTAYLGGATASNVRVGDPAAIVTVVLGVLVWLGLYLRDQRVRALLPLTPDE